MCLHLIFLARRSSWWGTLAVHLPHLQNCLLSFIQGVDMSPTRRASLESSLSCNNQKAEIILCAIDLGRHVRIRLPAHMTATIVLGSISWHVIDFRWRSLLRQRRTPALDLFARSVLLAPTSCSDLLFFSQSLHHDACNHGARPRIWQVKVGIISRRSWT